MPMVCHNQKWYVKSHFDCLDIKNVMVPLTMHHSHVMLMLVPVVSHDQKVMLHPILVVLTHEVQWCHS